jgi:protein SCO1
VTDEQSRLIVSNKQRILITLLLVFVAAGMLAVTGALVGLHSRPRVIVTGTASIGGPYTLTATNGAQVNERTYRGKWLLIYFGYTFCPDACPTALNNMSVALEKLGTRANNIQPLFVTIDPQRDTRGVMADYLKSFDPRILGLTGTQDEINTVIKEFHLYVSRDKSDANANDYIVSHSSYLYLMDPHGVFAAVLQGTATGDEIAAWARQEIAHAGT